MNFPKIKQTIRQYYIFYIIGFLVIFGLKYFYSKAQTDDLLWILTPTTWWVSVLSGIPFTYEPDMGYVNHTLKYVIAPSCSGVQFLIITISLLIFSFVHRTKKGFRWILGSIGISYLLTISVNGLRILVLFFVPQFFETHSLYDALLTPKRLHTIIGTAVYFASLLIIYRLADRILPKTKETSEEITGALHPTDKNRLLLRNCLPPVFWYFFIVLGIPLLNDAYQKEQTRFIEYLILISAVCGAVLLLTFLLSLIRRLLHPLPKSNTSSDINEA